ncbi:MAG: efflux RND transporter permease subunit, partial [Parafilimonas sp.]
MKLINIIYASLRKPVSVIVALIAIIVFAVLSITKMPVDIFPKMGTPTIYVAQTYGGLSPEQMEGFVSSYYEYHFLYVTGIKSVESKNIQGIALLKLIFYEDTDMSQAMSEVIAMVNRARAFMPPGTVAPFVTRFDAGSVPVGQLVFSSSTRSLSEIQDLALFKVRPMFSTLPGVSAPPPFGGNQRTVVIHADPNKLRSYNISPDDLVTAIAKGNTITPAGNLRVGDQTLITPQNTVVQNIKELEAIPIYAQNGATVYVKDIATVDNGADITSSYALINGKRSVDIPVTKRADAATWDVVKKVKAALPDMQAAIPSDIKVSYEFDQSGYVINSLKSLAIEGLLGAILTGLMVLLFLRDTRSALIVVMTIPLALLSAVICLNLFGQTINIMTLGGLALAIGILVDEATVTIENIHRHLETGQPKSTAILEACKEIAVPKFLILLCILAVFVPAFFMSGIPKAMFLPLTLAVGFAMIASFLLSQTFVPVISSWILKDNYIKPASEQWKRFQHRFTKRTEKNIYNRRWLVPLYIIASLAIAIVIYQFIGKEIFPKVDAGQFQVRLRLPAGTRLERTEGATKNVLSMIDTLADKKNIAITSAFIGVQGSSYPVNVIHLWTSGPNEAVIKVRFTNSASIHLEDFKERLRKKLNDEMPQAKFLFEPADLVDQVMSQGSSTPIEVVVQGKNLQQGKQYADKLVTKLQSISYMRDVQISAPVNYPGLEIDYDRIRTGQLGLTIDQVSKSTVAATASSRFTQPNYWLDKSAGNAYQVQVEIPQYEMTQPEDVENIPIDTKQNKPIYLHDIASLKNVNTVGEYDRINQQRYVAVTANLYNKDIGAAIKDVDKAIKSLDSLPTGIKIYQRGEADVFKATFSELQNGILMAVVVILLLLAANFQSFPLSFTVVSTVPAVIAGSFLLLFIAGRTLNIQSFMGCIMAIGVSVANAILFVTNAESYRKQSKDGAAVNGISNRLRPILMTSCAMIAGMIPMALGFGEGGDQTSPLGIAVIGGLLFSTIGSLFVLPAVYQSVIGRKSF